MQKKAYEICPTFESRGIPDPKSPSLVQNRRLNSVKIRLGELVVHVVEEGELVEDLRDPAVSGVLSFSDLVNFLLELLQT